LYVNALRLRVNYRFRNLDLPGKIKETYKTK
jgi:hypothetical protein